MIDLNKCEIIESRVQALLSTVPYVEEGTPMVGVYENGVLVAKPATGAANEIFLGFAYGRSATPTIVPLVDKLTVPATGPYTVTLSKTISGSDLGVAVIDSSGVRTVLTAGDPSTQAAQYSISAGVITVNSAQASKTLEATYRYAISLQEAQIKYAFNAFNAATFALPTTALLTVGEIFTDKFDVAANWAGFTGASTLKLGNGLVTLSGAGTTINAIVSSVPSAASPLLGLRVQAS